MANKKKFWILLALALLCSGLLVFVITMSVNGWDFHTLDTGNYQTTTHEISEDFNEIFVESDTADVVFLTATDGKAKVVCYEEENLKYSVQVKDGKLTIRETDTRKWYEYIGIFHFESAEISVYLPQSTALSLFVETDTGDVDANGFTFEKLAIETDTGDVALHNVVADTVHISVDTGDIQLTDVVANSKLQIETDTGDVEFVRCDANEIFVETDTGDVEGTLLTPKTFFAYSRTGDVVVPYPSEGGRCAITSNTGDIELRIAQ